jgi:hypothetical protein
MSNQYPNQFQQPAPQYTPPKKKRHVLRNIGIVVASLFALLILAAIVSPNTPAKDAATPAVVRTVDTGPTPDPVVTPTNIPTVVEPTTPPKPPAPKAKPMTASQEQAVGTAEDYLQGQSFSRKGLIEQLVYEGFSAKDATFGVDHVKVSWNEQAVGAAKDYLNGQHFSRSGLIEQLEYEGFTHKQAVYGVTKAGL